MRKYLMGTFISLLGVYFLLVNLNLIDIKLTELISKYWPILIIIWGTKVFLDGLIVFYRSLRRKKDLRTGKLVLGLIILLIGNAILGNKLGWFVVGAKEVWNWIWPVIIIFFGISIIFSEKGLNFEIDLDKKKDNYRINRRRKWVGELKYGEHGAWHLEDIILWQGIGSIYIDLSTAIVPEKEVMIDLTGLVGEITLLIPEGLPIKANVDVRVGEVKVFNHNQSGTGRFISYKSENYDQAGKKINLLISQSVGDVIVKQVD